jgi:nitric oxide reductase activation protein
MTHELMMTSEFPYTGKFSRETGNPASMRGVQQGIIIGTMLGRKLQIRSEVKTTKFTRLQKGKIDKRLLASIGFQGENLFYQTTTDKYKNAHLHVTVDASSSMETKWEKTMTTLVAIAKAVSMINNVTLSISFRSGVSKDRGGYETPYIVLAYDSRKDKFNKIVQLFPLLFPHGSTPEGLAFQAIIKHIPASTHEMDSYFVNLSDGEPAFGVSYYGNVAAEHTKKQINKIREIGVSVLSYFVECNNTNSKLSEKNSNLFRTMYGKDAQFVDVQNVVQIAHTLNKMFLSKES